MRRLENLAVVLIPFLAFSLVVNFVALDWLVQLEDYRREYQFVCEEYQRLQETYSPKPPISESEATDIALEHFGWNLTKGIGVTANPSYVMFRNSPTNSDFVFLQEVIADVSDYRPREICLDGDCITFRYVWAVAVSEVETRPGPVETITRHGEYFIDASTGEVMHFEVDLEPRTIGDG